ncbi:carboxypeptidase [Bifidobacterium sp. ESL0769]|uniref:S10 family peptidase n=1 Tax=Bifidobacterium sp. ESL0769 TaxID=2983229 RepID=UPI0023F9C674|nr:carboxypeptidase [Bifidobacterium sp. ESL0769]WEV66659.1 carboxypeptidase [Bifidobacterium sp. ESL0769]
MSEEALSAQTDAKQNTSAEKPAEPKLRPTGEHTTSHTMELNGETIHYQATVGTITIDTKEVKPAASDFYAAFELTDETGKTDTTRPVTFIFNGGPGSSSTFLMMGSLGPKRIDIPDAAPVPAAPYGLKDNPYTMLPYSDIVFIDAPGAGFSQIAEKAKKELYSVDGDVKGFSAFIRAYLTRFHRWNSPKYVLGESYGTTRGAALSYRLQQDGVALNGLVLISNILDYAYTFDTSDQFYIGYFPTFATVAHYHGKAGQDVDIATHLNTAREFANGPLRAALAQGDAIDETTKRSVAKRYAELTGLDEQYVYESDLRVVDMRFRKELLRHNSGENTGMIVGRYDGRSKGYDLDRTAQEETFVVDDSFLDPAYSCVANAYLRDELGWDGTEERRGFADFDWDSMEPGKGWTWWHTLPEGAKTSWGPHIPFPTVTPDLAAAIAHEPTLKVMIGNGIYDLCTPFNQTEYDIDHMSLPKPLRGNVAFTYYPAGHMLYTAPESIKKFAGDLSRFYASDVAGLADINERKI